MSNSLTEFISNRSLFVKFKLRKIHFYFVLLCKKCLTLSLNSSIIPILTIFIGNLLGFNLAAAYNFPSPSVVYDQTYIFIL